MPKKKSVKDDAIPQHYALLIGVDCYLPNRLPDGGQYRSLGGCVRDVEHVEAMLKRTLALSPDRIIKLTATNTAIGKPAEPSAQWPTYNNMVAAFKKLTDQAKAGAQVYIHYSGHGGRAATIFPKLKGENAYDEALVPTDIGDSQARYLRDVELATLLKGMVDKGLIVTAVLDSCHSGGMTRGSADVAIRGISSIDTTPRPTDSLVGSNEKLTQMWENESGWRTRNVKLGSGWLPEPKGYVLFAACRPSEYAFEYAFDGRERNGALTYWLLDSLKDLGPGLNYKALHDRIVAKVHSQFQMQTPQLQGEGDRVVFGSDRAQPVYAVPVIRVDDARGRILINAGQAHGLRHGAQFAIYPRGTTDFTDSTKRRALTEVDEVGASDSWAKVVTRFAGGAVEQGDQAALLGAGSVKLVRKVSLVRRDDLKPEIDQQAALSAVERALAGNGWIEVAAAGDQVSYQVAVNENGEYEIWDRTGEPIKNLRPPARLDAADAAATMARRLTHLAKYFALQQLSNNDPLSPLARKLVIELIGKRADYDPADPFEPEPFDEPGHTPTLKTGEWVGLRIKNNSPQILNVTVFDLQPDWGAAQIYPSGHGDNFVAFDPGQELVIPLQASLPKAYRTGRDIMKVFATVGATNFRWLELPALDQPRSRSGIMRSAPSDPLEAMFATFAAARPLTRNLTPATVPSKEWITAQVELNINQA